MQIFFLSSLWLHMRYTVYHFFRIQQIYKHGKIFYLSSNSTFSVSIDITFFRIIEQVYCISNITKKKSQYNIQNIIHLVTEGLCVGAVCGPSLVVGKYQGDHKESWRGEHSLVKHLKRLVIYCMLLLDLIFFFIKH